MMTGPGTRVSLGRVGGPYGVRGWVRVSSGTEPPERILEYHPWLIERGGTWQPFEVLARQGPGGAARRLR
jgi:16S rRNA processing protein RimM